MNLKDLVSKPYTHFGEWKVAHQDQTKFELLQEAVNKAVKAIYKSLKDFFLGLYHHTEGIAITALSAIGLNALLSELPFMWTLPMWIEAPMVIPVIAVIIILCLMRSAEWRASRRLVKA